jgi:hypothetical protein
LVSTTFCSRPIVSFYDRAHNYARFMVEAFLVGSSTSFFFFISRVSYSTSII